MCSTSKDNEYLKNSFKNFINYYFLKPQQSENENKNKLPAYCREERQYALFLYNKILDMVNKRIYDKEDINLLEHLGLEVKAKILQVYYEVAFMRDFLDKEKNNSESKFNKCLFDYVLEKFGINNNFDNVKKENKENKDDILSTLFKDDNDKNYDFLKNYKVIPNINYGSNAKDDDGEGRTLPVFIRKFMRAMMNSKPDIGLIYLNSEGKKCLKFLECKYLSPEGAVQLIDDKEKNSLDAKKYVLPQTVIQFFIAEFICRYVMKGSNIWPNYPSIINFVNSNSNDKTGKSNEKIDRISTEETDNSENDNYSDGSKGDKPIDTFIDRNIYAPKWYKEEIIEKQKPINISDLVPECLKQPIF